MKKKILSIAVIASMITILLYPVYQWKEQTEKTAHIRPAYPQTDISQLLTKETLEEADYKSLYLQTGMTKTGIDDLWQENRQGKLLCLQERLFRQVQVSCEHSVWIARGERLTGEPWREVDFFLPDVEDGDILITFSGHLLGWRSGHAAMVVEEETGLTIEAVTVGSSSHLCLLEQWQKYPQFALLRLKGASREERQEIAEYAKEQLVQVPYSLLAFHLEAADGEALSGTNCSHLVWAAYRHFGYELDSNGGIFVTPEDIYNSPALELIQVYGVNLEEN